MKKVYSRTVRIITILIAIIAFDQDMVMSMQKYVRLDTTKSKPITISASRISKPVLYNSTATRSGYISFKPGSSNIYSGIFTPKSSQADPVNMLNVKIYPIPVSDQINLSYHLNKDSYVTIEVFDILGVKVSTLLAQRLPAGEQKNSFSIASKLNSGFIYYVRVTAGNQLVTKRISVL